MNTVFKNLAARWQQLQPRERRLAFWCGIVIAGAALLTIEDWQRHEHIRLAKALPAAEARLASMQKLADEFNSLSARRQNGAKAKASPELLTASAKATGLPLDLVVTGTSQVMLKGSVAFDQWVDWLDDAATQGWRVETATVRRDAPASGGRTSGTVVVEATLGAVAE
jgi:type II secretory pathway component PulM